MAKVFSKGNTDFEPAPADMHNGVCIGVFDIGTHEGMYGAKRKVRLLFEIDSPRKDGKNFTVSADFGFTISKKATLRKIIEGWRGKEFTEAEEDAGYDLGKLVGQPASIQVLHSKDGKWANIGTISKIMKGITPLKPSYPLCTFFFDDHGKNIPDGTPDWIAKKIKLSQEWTGKKGATEEDDTQDSREQFDAGTVQEQVAATF